MSSKGLWWPLCVSLLTFRYLNHSGCLREQERLAKSNKTAVALRDPCQVEITWDDSIRIAVHEVVKLTFKRNPEFDITVSTCSPIYQRMKVNGASSNPARTGRLLNFTKIKFKLWTNLSLAIRGHGVYHVNEMGLEYAVKSVCKSAYSFHFCFTTYSDGLTLSS